MANNDLNTNPLFQNIAQKANEVKATYAGMPTFQTNIQTGVVGNDQTLNEALGGYTDKVAELFAHDKQISSSYAAPTSENYIEDPYARATASASLYAQKGKEMAGALKIYETRKNVLGDLVDKAMKMYDAGIKGKELEYDQAKTEFDNAFRTAQLAETKRSNLATEEINRGKALNKIGATGIKEIDESNDADIQQLFVQKFGNKAWNNLGAVSQRATSARQLLASAIKGENINVKDLLDSNEQKAWDAQDKLSTDVSIALANFGDLTGAGGTGPLAGLFKDTGLLSAVTPQSTKKLRTAISSINSQTIKDLSGVAVSDREYERLVALIPDKFATEEENKRRLNLMKARIEANKELQTLAKMNNLTNSQVIEKFGSQIWTKYGLNSDGSNPNTSTSSPSTGRPPLSSFNK